MSAFSDIDWGADQSRERFFLIDFVAIVTFDRWEKLVYGQSGGAIELSKEKQGLSVGIVAAGLALAGYPLELAFGSSCIAAEPVDYEFSESPALKKALELHVKLGLSLPTSAGSPFVRLTTNGRSLMREMLPRIETFDRLFQILPGTYFAPIDSERKEKIAPSRPSIRHFIYGRLADLDARPTEELREIYRDVVTAIDRRGSSVTPLFLLEYVIIVGLGSWESLIRDQPREVWEDQAEERLRTSLLIAAMILCDLGYPLELAVRFQDVTTTSASGLDFVKSKPLDDAFGLHRNRGMLNLVDEALPFACLTSDGRLRQRELLLGMEPFDRLFQMLPPAYFIAFDVLNGEKNFRPKQSIRQVLYEILARLVTKSPDRLRIELIEMATAFAGSGYERRGYFFDQRYLDLAARSRKRALLA